MFKSIVLICCHNGENYIFDQISSILNQTVKIDQIEIFDYNSSDNTIKIIQELRKNNKNINLKRFDYAISVSHSFFNSINIVKETNKKSNYILYLSDQDDYWNKGKNEIVINYFNKGYEFIFHDVIVSDENLKTISSSYYNNFWKIDRDFRLPNLFFSNPVIGHTMAISKKVIENIDLNYDERIPMHDWYLSLQILVNQYSYLFIESPLSIYRQHDNNVLGAYNNGLLTFHKKVINHGKNIKRFHSFLADKKIIKNKLSLLKFKKIKLVRPLNKLIYIYFSQVLTKNV